MNWNRVEKKVNQKAKSQRPQNTRITAWRQIDLSFLIHKTGRKNIKFLEPDEFQSSGYLIFYESNKINVHACSVAQLCLTLRCYGLWSTRLLCPWDFPDKNVGIDCHFFLKGIFTQAPTCVSCVSCIGRWILYHCTTWEAQSKHTIHYMEPWEGLGNYYFMKCINISVMKCVPNGLKTISCLTLGYVSFCCWVSLL